MNLAQTQKTYHTDHSIVYSCQYHVVWCPKYRRKLLVNPINKRLKELILEKQPYYGYTIISMEIMSDHIHLLVDIDPRIGIQEVVTKIKGFTAFQLRKEFPFLKSKTPTLWTRSKFISTVGAVSLSTVKRTIENQKSL